MFKTLICLGTIAATTLTAGAAVDIGTMTARLRAAVTTPAPVALTGSMASATTVAPPDDVTAHALSRFATPQAQGLRLESPVLDGALDKTPAFKAAVGYDVVHPLKTVAAVKRAAALKGSAYIAKDVNHQGRVYTAPMTIEPITGDEDGNPLENTFELYNIYGTGSLINMTVDPEAGTVAIPSQTVMMHQTYGEVKVCPIGQTATGFTYNDREPITGVINADGSISLNPWGIIVTDESSSYRGAAFNFMLNSVWYPSNATVKATNVKSASAEEYPIYIEQTAGDAATFYCLSGITGDILSARLTPRQTVVLSPQKIYANAMYGDFYMYPATVTDDGKVGVYNKSNVTATVDNDGALAIPAWAIAAKAFPSQYIGYVYKDITISGPGVTSIAYPQLLPTSWQGEGTASSPWLINTVDDLTALTQAVNGGESMQGKYFALTASLTPAPFTPIGDQENPWRGNFDGRGNSLSGFTLDNAGFANTGIFGWIDSTGVVRNLNVTGVRMTTVGDNLGTIAGFSDGTISNCHVTSTSLHSDGTIAGGIAGGSRGTISDCSFTGSVTVIGSGGGIAGQAYGDIVRCSVRANLTTDGYVGSTARDIAGIAGLFFRGTMEDCWMSGTVTDEYGMAVTGGLVGRISAATVRGCHSVAAIQAKRLASADDNYTGGLAAYASDATIEDSWFSGTIIKSGTSEYVGGLVGYLGVGYSTSSATGTSMINIVNLRRCYSSATIVTPSSNAAKGIYGATFLSTIWDGIHPQDACISDCWYDAQINDFDDGRWGRPTAFFTTGQAVPGLDAYKWQFEAGRYPVLKTMKDQVSARLAASPLLLQDGQTAKKVKGWYEWTPDTDVAWQTQSEAVTVDGNRATIGPEYATVVTSAVTSDNWALKLYRLALVPDLFNGLGTKDDPYRISTAADWERLNQGVSDYGQEHEGDYFVMTNDIDLSGSATFHGLGWGKGASVKFGGDFDGLGHTVTGLTIDAPVMKDATSCDNTQSVPYTGLFGLTTTKARIANLVMGASNNLRMYSYGGAVAAVNNGVMENIVNHAAVLAFNSANGGIVGLNNGTMLNCYNDGTVTSCSFNAGGIAGYNNPTGVIDGCHNDGDVKGEPIDGINPNTLYNTFGGITGYNYGKTFNSVNAGQVTAYNTVGGIAGVANGANGQGHIEGCVNTGMVTARDVCVTRGALVGELRADAPLHNNYYDLSINVNGGANNGDPAGVTGLSTSQLTDGSAPEGTQGLDLAAGKYPVRAAFASQPSAAALRGIFMGFAPRQRRTNVTSQVSLSVAQGLEWTLEEGSNAFALDGNTLTVAVPADAVGTGTLNAAMGTYAKTYPLSAIPSILKGEGTADAPWLIETPADWNKLARFVETSKWEYPGDRFNITADLDFAGDSIAVMAVSGTTFQGHLDGCGHTVKGFVYENLNSVKTRLAGPNLYVGKNIGCLIGTLGTQGTVSNVTCEGRFKGYQLLGGVVGDNYGTIDNVVSRVDLTNSSGGSLGGVVYKSWAGSSVTNSAFEGTLKTVTTNAGGIAFFVDKNVLVRNCENRGVVETGTSGACGLAYTGNGTFVNCHNRGTVRGTGTAAGLVYSLGANASMEGCNNYSDLDYVTGLTKAGTGICGLVSTTTTRKPADTDLSGGYIKDCVNYGNINAGDGAYGAVNVVKHGWTLTGVHNLGNVTSTGYASGFGKTIGEFSAGNDADAQADVPNAWCTLMDCSNRGDITGNKAGVAGLCETGYNYTRFLDCYNLGTITNTNTGLTTAGLVAKNNSQLIRCFNAGDIYSTTNANGGLCGYLSDGKPGARGLISRCFNLGNLITDYTGTNSNGAAGGLVGYFAGTGAPDVAAIVEYSYNAGAVIGNNRVGGLSGGAFRPFVNVHHCYNSGRVICLEPDDQGRYYWSGTTFTNSYTYKVDGEDVFMLANHSDCYYDATVSAGGQFRNVPGSAKTTAQMGDLLGELGDEFTYLDHGGYPVLKDFADHKAAHASTAMMVLYNQAQDHSAIGDFITLIAPEGTVWEAFEDVEEPVNGVISHLSYRPSPTIYFEDNMLKFNGKADNVLVKATVPDGHSRSFVVSVDPALSSRCDMDIESGQVESREYYDLQGRRTMVPVAGQVYIERTRYTDGTARARKVTVR